MIEIVLSVTATVASLFALNTWRHERRSIIARDVYAAVIQADIAIARCVQTARATPDFDARDDTRTAIAVNHFKSRAEELQGAITELRRAMPKTKANFPHKAVLIEAFWIITYGVVRALKDHEVQVLYNVPSATYPEDWETYDLPWNAIFADSAHPDVVSFRRDVSTLVRAVRKWAEGADQWFYCDDPQDDVAYMVARRYADTDFASHLAGFGAGESSVAVPEGR